MVKQLNLFTKRSFNITRELKEQMAEVVIDSGLSREEYLERMNQLADRFGVHLVKGNGRGLSMATFEKWLNPNNTEHIPGPNAMAVFAGVTDTIALLQVQAAPHGAMVIDEEDVKLLLWAKEYQKVKTARAVMKKLESEL